jgi:hypothetical protein
MILPGTVCFFGGKSSNALATGAPETILMKNIKDRPEETGKP